MFNENELQDKIENKNFKKTGHKPKNALGLAKIFLSMLKTDKNIKNVL